MSCALNELKSIGTPLLHIAVRERHAIAIAMAHDGIKLLVLGCGP